MHLEVDAIAPHILNRRQLNMRDVHHQLRIPADPFPTDPFVPSVRELWEDERNRRIAAGLPPSPAVPRDLSEKSRGIGGDWAAEARWWQKIGARIQQENGHDVKAKDQSWARWLMTSFESVQSLWPERHRSWKHSNGQSSDSSDIGNPYADVTGCSQDINGEQRFDDEANADTDVVALTSQEVSKMMQEEDTVWAELQDGSNEDGIGEESAFYNDYLQAEPRSPPVEILSYDASLLPPAIPTNTQTAPRTEFYRPLTSRGNLLHRGTRSPHLTGDPKAFRMHFVGSQGIVRFICTTKVLFILSRPAYHGSPSAVDGYRTPNRFVHHHNLIPRISRIQIASANKCRTCDPVLCQHGYTSSSCLQTELIPHISS